MTIVIEKTAEQVLRRMPRNISKLIVAKLEAYVAAPTDLANVVVAMQGGEFAGMLRMRVGDWRVLMSWNGATLIVYNVAPRGEIYR